MIRYRMFWARLGFLCALVLGVLLCHPASAQTPADPVDAPGHNGKIYCPLTFFFGLEYAGTVEEVFVVPGDMVEEGQILARYRLQDEAALNLFYYLDANASIQGPYQLLTDNNIILYQSERELSAAKRLSAAQMGSAEQQQSLQSSVEILRQNRNILTTRLAQTRLIFEERQRIVERKLGTLPEPGKIPEIGYIRSTVAGEVLSVTPSLRGGMILNAMEGSVTLGQTNPMEVRTRVFEADIPGLLVGGTATVRVLSLDEREYEGVITSIDRSSDDMSVDRPSYYAVRIDVPNDDGALRAGFKAMVHFAKEPR